MESYVISIAQQHYRIITTFFQDHCSSYSLLYQTCHHFLPSSSSDYYSIAFEFIWTKKQKESLTSSFRVPEEWNSLYASLLTQLSLSSYVHGYLYVLSNHSSVLIPLHDLSI